jgi:hypothetical protein
MTADQRQEYRYRYDERLGILCGKDEPTDEQIKIAKSEADEWLKLEEWRNKDENTNRV